MACAAVLSNFEVRLTDEIVQYIAMPGKVFRTELTDIVMLAGVSGECPDNFPRQTVHLEKTNDNLIKLFITVYKSTVASSTVDNDSQTASVETGLMQTQTYGTESTKTGKTQTDSTQWTGIGSSQTEHALFLCASTTQTDGKQCEPVSCQTAGEDSIHGRATLVDGVMQSNSAEFMRVGATQYDIAEFQCSAEVQTDGVQFTSTSATQTDTKKFYNIRVQTEEKRTARARVQTDSVSLATTDAQTDEIRVKQTFADFATETDFNLSTQSEKLVQAVVQTSNIRCQATAHVTDIECQASAAIADGAMQTDWMGAHCETQTELSVAWRSECETQASVDLKDASLQAVVPSSAIESQTEMSLAWMESRESQATVSVTESPSQTDVNAVSEIHSQTDASMSLMTDCESQATVESMEVLSQTALVDIVDGYAQTDEIVAAPKSSQESQATVDSAEARSQTESNMVAEIHSQTDADVVTPKMSQESQATVNCAEVRSQTETSMLSHTTTSSQAVADATDSHTVYDPPVQVMKAAPSLSAHDTTINESFDDYGPHDVIDSLLSQTFDSDRNRGGDAVCDASAQTDPVTIIIGDASFLVNKLKNSALSPSRITTSGNEIEIELSADTMARDSGNVPLSAEGITPGVPSNIQNENILLQQQHYRPAPPAVASPSSARPVGIITRGGAVGAGPRFRMPVAEAVALRQQDAIRGGRPPGLLVRPPQSMVSAASLQVRGPVVRKAQTAQQLPVLIAGPQPVIGGAFSCPFCALRFIDSPALYEHLSVLHTVDQQTKWKQPLGRTGKTILPKKATSAAGSAVAAPAKGQANVTAGPPILTPAEPLVATTTGGTATANRSQNSTVASTAVVRKNSRGAAAANNEGGGDVGHESSKIQEQTELFEDPVEPPAPPTTKKMGAQRGGRVLSKSTADETRRRSSSDGVPASKRARVAEDDSDDVDDDALVTKTKTTPSGGRRGGRTPRSQKKS